MAASGRSSSLAGWVDRPPPARRQLLPHPPRHGSPHPRHRGACRAPTRTPSRPPGSRGSCRAGWSRSPTPSPSSWPGWTACACSSGALGATLAGLAWTLLRPAERRGDPACSWSASFLDHRRRALGGTSLHGRADRPGAPACWPWRGASIRGGCSPSAGCGSTPTARSPWASRCSWWRPWASGWTGARAPASSACLRWIVPGMLLGAVGPLGPRVLLFPVELLSARSSSPRSSSGGRRRSTRRASASFILQLVFAIVLVARRPSYRSALLVGVFSGAALLGRSQPHRRLARHAPRHGGQPDRRRLAVVHRPTARSPHRGAGVQRRWPCC